ncbi:MAG: HlyC/CorC family transporter [Bacteroidales bacterium]|nr:HlyC/CorC family transporter [Candidatus Colicola caccequi]MCQ2327836.1 hemolysin family protein [Paludibacteraceae bacterium]
MTTLLIFLFIAMGVSFLCSTLESVLMSTTLSFINLREEEGYAPAKRMKQYKTEPEVPLAAILSLNTIANTVGAAGVGQQANILFGSQWFGLVSAIVTLLILIFSEIIPKTFGTTYWKNLMGFTAGTIRVLIVLMYPFVKLIHWVSRLFPENEESIVSREEVVALANVGEQEGVIEEDEKKIIRNVIRLDEIKASDVMTPRVVASIAPESMTLKDYYDCDDYDHFSRIPVYNDSPEYITGYVMRDDALENLTEDHFSKTLGEIKRSIPQFNENMSIGDIFDQMLKEKSQIGIIIDEYGCFQGILTLEDVIETIFGLEIIDENDEFADMQQYARERWRQRQKRFRQPLPKGKKD